MQPKIITNLKVLANLLHFSVNHLLLETHRALRQPLPLNESMVFSREGRPHLGKRSRSNRSRQQFLPPIRHLWDPHLYSMSPEENPPRWTELEYMMYNKMLK